ncbi:MAG TPA: 50S ribosomal protein L29 [Ktedonobacterales bacterium]
MSKLSERRREIHAMDLAAAQHELAQARDQLFRLRLQAMRGDVKNNRLFPQTKKDVARLMQHIGELIHAEEVIAEGGLIEEEEEPAGESAAPSEEHEA